MKCLALVASVLSVCVVPAADPYVVGVFDVGLTGGDGASSAGFLKAFDDLDEYEGRALDSLDMGTLLQCDIVIMYDVHRPGKVTDKWRDNVAGFAKIGGSVLSVYHQHEFRSIGPGVLKVPQRQVRPVGDTPLVAGIEAFTVDWKDHIILAPGPDATVFLENAKGRPVAAFGPFGKGKVISCGLGLGIRSDWRGSKPPPGPEGVLLRNMLDWLQPEERWPVRLAAHAVESELSVISTAKFARQPQPIIMTIRGILQDAETKGTMVVAITDAAGKVVTARVDLAAQPVPGAQCGKVRATCAVSTEGLASGPATVRYVLDFAGAETKDEFPVQLVRAEPPAEEFRAFWSHAFEDRLPEDVMPRIKACGFNAVIPRISGGTGAFYLSKVLPDVKNILGEEDWLANCIKHAKANGLQVHPYRNCFIMEGRASKETIAEFRAASRLQEAPDGAPLDWMCPSQDINRQVEVAAAGELVRDYDIDGFQFDFIRYPNDKGCYCPRCRAKFEKLRGEAVANWPADVVRDGALFDEYTAFRQQQITDTVKLVSEAIRKIKPEIRISAAVFRDYARDSVTVGQDWATWAKEGYVDFLCPMDYTEDVGALDGWVRDQMDRVGEYVPICAGLGLAASRARMKTPEDMALQIDIARQAGAKGFVLFAWSPGCDEKIVLPQRDDSLAGDPPVPWE